MAKVNPNWLDRTVGWLSPRRGALRLAARAAIAAQLGFEGARADRRTSDWLTGGNSADAESALFVGTLRNRARDLVRNNPYAARALEVKVANTIGTGIVAEVETKTRTIRSAWDAFVDNCDADGNLDLYGIQALVERCRSESGEVLVRRVPTPMRGAGSRVGFGLRVLEPDYLDEAHDTQGIVPRGGAVIRRGIEYDANGRPAVYWLFPEHPGDSLRSSHVLSVPVPASEVIHLFRRLRPGQGRGVTDFAPVMLRLRDLDDYDDAEVMRKKIEAAMAVFVTTSSPPPATGIGPASSDSAGRIEGLSPGMVEYLSPGQNIAVAEPKASGGYADFKRFAARDIAAGYGVPYELMTGDLSTVNYSSYRAGLVDFRRRVEQDQWGLYVPVFCERVKDWFLSELGAADESKAGSRTPFAWTPPRFELIDPQNESQAEILQVLAGIEPFDEIVRRHGYPFEKHLDRLEKVRDELDKRGLVLTSDARVNSGPTVSRPAPSAAPSSGGGSPQDAPDAGEPQENAGSQTTVINMPAPVQLAPPLREEPAPPVTIRRTIRRDAHGRITEIVSETLDQVDDQAAETGS